MIRCLIGCNRFDENLVDEEEQRVHRVEVFEDIQNDDQEREGVVAQGERARPLPQRSRAGVYIAYEEQGDPMRIAEEQDKVRKKENNT